MATVFTTVINGVTFYALNYVEWRERKAWWHGCLWGVIASCAIIWILGVRR